jgi:hypothetical protein
MGTVPGLAGGMATGQRNAGIPVPGNTMGLNQNSPITGGNMPPPSVGTRPGSAVPGAGGTGSAPAFKAPGGNVQALGSPSVPGSVSPINTPPVAATGATGTPPASASGNPITQKQQTDLNRQLTDIYGSGTGSTLAGLIGDLGSNDSSYMQAYNAAMAKQTAEGVSTIGTSLGNAGISANSSASAIEKGDYLSGVTAQAGLQEQQLLQTQQQTEAGLLQGVQSDSAKETGTSWLDTLGQVVGIAGDAVGAVTGLSSIGGSVSSLFKGAAPGAIPGGSAAPQLPGAFSGGYAGPMPSSIPGTQSAPNLPGLDF